MPAAICAPQPDAVDAGATILRQGGNAIDAAVACALAQAIVDPQDCGLGGYALVNLHLAGTSGSLGLDAPALAGAKVTDDMWADQVIRPNPDGWGFFLKGHVNESGYTSVCTPGTVKMLAALLERWGTRSWAEVAAPAMRLAEEGWMVGGMIGGWWQRSRRYPETLSFLDQITRHAEASRIYLHDGNPYEAGDVIRNPDYARSLQRIIDNGPEDFYHGELMEQMTGDLAANGSFVTRQDFESYALREQMSVSGTYRGHVVTSAAPPHGGPTLIAILNILEGYDLAALGHNSPEYIYTVAMAMKAAFADRNPHMADPNFEEVPTEWMMTKERAGFWRDHIAAGQPIDAAFTPTGSPHTTHVSVVDGAGNVVNLTHSLGMSSGVITPGLGFMYNNSMVNFHPWPGHPNSIAPGKGRTTGMAPTTVYRKDDTDARHPLLALGAPGATRIITGCLQVILNVLDFGMSAAEAVYAPRFDCQVGTIRYERRIPGSVMAEVAKRHPVLELPYSYGGVGLVHAIHIDPMTGALSGGADGGGEGMAVVVETGE